MAQQMVEALSHMDLTEALTSIPILQSFGKTGNGSMPPHGIDRWENRKGQAE